MATLKNRPNPFKKAVTHRHSTRKRDPFYSSTEWIRLRSTVVAHVSRCAYCHAPFKPGAKKVGEHFRPRRLYPELELTPSNIYAVCEKCNNAKSAREQYINSREQWEAKVMPEYIHNKWFQFILK